MRELLVLEPFCESHMEKITSAIGCDFVVKKPGENSEEDIRSAEIIVGQPPIDILNSCPDLKFVQMTWAGTDIYTRTEKAFPSDKVMLANMSGAYGLVISQFVIGQILTMMLNFKIYHDRQRDKVWLRQSPIKSLVGAKVMIYGTGDIGSCTAKRLQGFDCHVTGVCRNTGEPREYFDELCTLQESVKYLPQMDVVICAIPNTIDTVGFMSRERLSLMKEGSVIVNVGRGNFIDCMALNSLLDSGHIWGAALDVTNPEPLPKNHPLWENKRCFITPHTSGVAFEHLKETEDLICDIVCENLKNYVAGREIRNRVY